MQKKAMKNLNQPKPKFMPEKWMPLNEFIKYSGLGRTTVFNYCKDGCLECRTYGHRKYINVESLMHNCWGDKES